MNIKKLLTKNYVNFRGWSSSKKIVVIESDDWGAIRTPSAKVIDIYKKNNIKVDYFINCDTLESEEDLTQLFRLLSSYKDHKGNHPVITANALAANPDFDKIEASGLKEYHYELITETYKRYYPNADTFGLWKKEGIGKKMLWPQFHGREHLNPMQWMKTLNAGEGDELLAFKNKALYGVIDFPGKPRLQGHMAAFDYHGEEEFNEVAKITEEGLSLFEQLFGFRSKSFVASCSIRTDRLDDVLVKNGVMYHQGGQNYCPTGTVGEYKLVNRYWGDVNKLGQLYWRRNVTFEPSRNPAFNWVDSCMEEINIAFRWGKPAVINSHRVNYVGSLVKENREKNLEMLDSLLSAIMKKWPDVEFMSSDMLGDYITSTKKK